jgi:hypothetical protein
MYPLPIYPTRSSAHRAYGGRKNGVGRISNVWGARHDSISAGLGTLTKVKLRWASLSEIDGTAYRVRIEGDLGDEALMLAAQQLLDRE